MTSAQPVPAVRRSAWLSDVPIPTRPKWPAWSAVAIGAGVIAYVMATLYGIATGDPRMMGAIAVVPAIVFITAVMARALAKQDRDPTVVPLLLGAVSLKLLGSAVRFWTAYSIYDGGIDAGVYDKAGRGLAAQWRQLNFTYDIPGKLVGTNFVKLLTGVVYTVTPATEISGFLMFSWVGFLGFVLFWRAFRLAVPEGDSRKYALLVLLLPSLVYWPSSIGKEAWMMLALGITAYGAARVAIARTSSGLACILLGTAAIIGVRPHVAICLFAGLTALMLVVCTQWKRMQRPVVPMIALLVLFLAANVVVQQTKKYLGVESLTQEAVTRTLDEATRRSSQGGSEFTPVRVNNPIKFPLGFGTVFYRPFPIEVHNPQQLIASLEGLILLAATMLSWRSLASIPRRLRASPYLAYALAFIVAFVVAFSAFSNFGLLARQRTQVLPLYLVFLALPSLKQPARTALGNERAGAELGAAT
jgi:hypothetical protein